MGDAPAKAAGGLFSPIHALLNRISNALGIQMNGFLAGIAVALFFIWNARTEQARKAEFSARRGALGADGIAGTSGEAGKDDKVNLDPELEVRGAR